MSGRTLTTLTNDFVVPVVEAANDLQDHIVRTYFAPNAVTLVYWSFAVVFLYLGVQKVLPHRSTADVQLATIGGLLGVPYVTFVAVIGVWQMCIGGAFLFRRLRLAALFFFSYQVFAVGSLFVLRYIVFQPPYLDVFGIEIQWALGLYAAFILKNLVLAGVFFVLASEEVDLDQSSQQGVEA